MKWISLVLLCLIFALGTTYALKTPQSGTPPAPAPQPAPKAPPAKNTSLRNTPLPKKEPFVMTPEIRERQRRIQRTNPFLLALQGEDETKRSNAVIKLSEFGGIVLRAPLKNLTRSKRPEVQKAAEAVTAAIESKTQELRKTAKDALEAHQKDPEDKALKAAVSKAFWALSEYTIDPQEQIDSAAKYKELMAALKK